MEKVSGGWTETWVAGWLIVELELLQQKMADTCGEKVIFILVMVEEVPCFLIMLQYKVDDSVANFSVFKYLGIIYLMAKSWNYEIHF